jgi:hypothetical protein
MKECTVPSQPNFDTGTECTEYDFSTPEGQQALAAALDLVLEIRNGETGPMARRMALYEKTLGAAVIPVLLRRAFIVLRRRAAKRGGTAR